MNLDLPCFAFSNSELNFDLTSQGPALSLQGPRLSEMNGPPKRVELKVHGKKHTSKHWRFWKGWFHIRYYHAPSLALPPKASLTLVFFFWTYLHDRFGFPGAGMCFHLFMQSWSDVWQVNILLRDEQKQAIIQFWSLRVYTSQFFLANHVPAENVFSIKQRSKCSIMFKDQRGNMWTIYFPQNPKKIYWDHLDGVLPATTKERIS